ncbi:hypothetical protein N665_0198s0302 [Sinapis alba]|nr:hypothetical protein N665_0198s0302 [Sinapis alba]
MVKVDLVRQKLNSDLFIRVLSEFKRQNFRSIVACNRGSPGAFSSVSSTRWKKLPIGVIKCNMDRSFLNTNVRGKAGWILRDDNGHYKGSSQAAGKKVQNAFEGELHAILIVVQHCWVLGDIKFTWTRREANKVADKLAKA